MESMTFVRCSNHVRPKINSSSNLHKHLAGRFLYITLSSVAGLAGHIFQAKYATGMAFQDTLALDFEVVQSAGCAA